MLLLCDVCAKIEWMFLGYIVEKLWVSKAARFCTFSNASIRHGHNCRPSQQVTYTVGFYQRNSEENRQTPNKKICIPADI